MKRINFIHAVVLLTIAGIGTTYVVGQNSELSRIDQKPRRMRGTLPPIVTASSQADDETSLPHYKPQENVGQTVVGTVGTSPQQSDSRNSSQMRLVSHDAQDDAANMNRPAVLNERDHDGTAIANPAVNGPNVRQDNAMPASATFRQPSAMGNASPNGAQSQYIGTMPVNGNGNWGNRDDVPEHVFQGLGQIREQSVPAQSGQTLSPGSAMMFDESTEMTPPGNFNIPAPPQPMQQGGAMPETHGEPDGLIPFRPILPGQAPVVENETVPMTASHDFLPDPNNAANDDHERSGGVRMSFGAAPNALAQEKPVDAGTPSAMIPPAQPAMPTDRIARNGATSVDVRYDGNSVPFGNSATSPSDQEGIALPGSSELTGVQVPQLVIEKLMPNEAQINEPMTIAINIRNTGSAKAKNVVVTDRLPKGARFVEAGASASRTADGDICWQLGDLGINEERTVELCLVPTAEGEIGSVATATFSVDASASTRITKPGLKMEVTTSAEEHLVGGSLSLEILISNPGTGIARNIMIEEYVPDGLSHPKGKKLAATFGDLNPNESKRLKLTLKCERAGEMTNYLVAKGENDLMVESKIPITVLAPALTLAIDGPKNRYLERKATYELQVANPGSATTRDIQLAVKLPSGVDFSATDSMGAYDPETHTVHWMLEALPSRQSGVIELVTVPREIGEHKIEFIGRAQGGLQASASHEVSVDGIASLGFEIANKVDPVELGREAEYEIRVFNRGTKASANVALRVQLPDGMRFVAADGPTQYRVSGAVVDFNNLAQIDPRGEKTYFVRAQCLAAGDQRVVVQLQSDEMERPVTKEENTNVYGDE